MSYKVTIIVEGVTHVADLEDVIKEAGRIGLDFSVTWEAEEDDE